MHLSKQNNEFNSLVHNFTLFCNLFYKSFIVFLTKVISLALWLPKGIMIQMENVCSTEFCKRHLLACSFQAPESEFASIRCIWKQNYGCYILSVYWTFLTHLKLHLNILALWYLKLLKSFFATKNLINPNSIFVVVMST